MSVLLSFIIKLDAYSTGIIFQKVVILIHGKENVLMVSLSSGKRMEYSHISLPLCLMYVCSVFHILQKHFQKVCIVLPDIMKHRDIALLKLRSMLGTPYAGGSEETWVK
jgi:hypothetical protein